MKPLPDIPDVRFPAPDDPSDPESTFTLTKQEAADLQHALSVIVNYLVVEYRRCGATQTGK